MSLAPYFAQLRDLHIACAAASLALFIVRGVWMLRGSALLQARWVRIVPHVIDTVLLASAIALTTILQQYPLANGWLSAKLFALIAYIVLGTIALKRGRTRAVRIGAFAAALLTFAYIVAVAVTQDAAPWR